MRSIARRSWPWFVALIAINIIAYAYVLRVPFLLDDVIQFRWLSRHEFWSILTTATGLSYYRPISLLLWKALWFMQGRYDAPTLHAINLLVHILNTLLVMTLLVTLRRSTQSKSQSQFQVAPFAAAILFALFPFSYQAVPWVGALYHVLVLFFMLLALVLALATHRGLSPIPTRLAHIGSLVCTFLAPLTHETGIMTLPLLVLILSLDSPEGISKLSLRTMVQATWQHAGVTLIVFGLTMAMRENAFGATTLNPSLENLYQVGAYFVQGLIYPVAPLARLVQRVGLDDIQAIYVVGVSAVLAWLLLIRRTGQRKTILLALGWFGICLLPGFLFLKFPYVIDGPRLLYQAAVGIALLWVAPLDVLAARLEVGRWRPLLFGLIPLIALASSIWFLQDKAAIYMQSTRLVDQLLMVTPPQAKGPYLLVNFPRWLAPPQSWFTLGHEGIPIVPEYASMYDYYWTVSGRETPIEDVQVDDVKRNWRYSYALVGTPRGTEDMQGRIRKNGRTIFVDLSTRNAIVYDAGRLEAQTTPPATDYIAAYGGALALITGTVQHDAAALQVTLIWQSWRKLPPEQELNTFVHVQKPNGELVAQTDGFPIANLARPSFWLPGDQWRDTRLVPLPDNLPPGEYLVRVGMYPTAGGDRLVALSPQQVRYENDSALVGRMVLP